MTDVPHHPRPEAAAADEGDAEQARIDRLVIDGPAGTFVVAGIATALVLAIYVLFYLFVYLPRGAVQ